MSSTTPAQRPGSREIERLIVVDIIRHLLLRAVGSRGVTEYLAIVTRVRSDLDATLAGGYGAFLRIHDGRFDVTVEADPLGITVRVNERQPRVDTPALEGIRSAFVVVTRDSDGTTVLRIPRGDDLSGGVDDIRALVDRLLPVARADETSE